METVSDMITSTMSQLTKNTEPHTSVQKTSSFKRDWREVYERWKVAVDNAGIDEAIPYFAVLCSKVAVGSVKGDKGICLMGRPGCGKTFRMKFISKSLGIKFYKAQELVDYISDNAQCNSDFNSIVRVCHENCIGNKRYNHLCIDDLGSETHEKVKYGDRDDIMSRVLEARFNAFEISQERGDTWYTHITTNLLEDEFIRRYGERLWSRLNKMCVIINMPSIDRRLSC